jgi:anti-sigma B factor antagonist
MPEAATTFEVRELSERASAIDIKGDITASSEDVLMDAYGRASDSSVKAIVLNFSELEYMNSGGIGLLVTLLVRAQRQRQRVLAYGLSDHYRQIFELTRLDVAVVIHDSQDAALAAAGAS